jgi:hypothetical protein
MRVQHQDQMAVDPIAQFKSTCVLQVSFVFSVEQVYGRVLSSTWPCCGKLCFLFYGATECVFLNFTACIWGYLPKSIKRDELPKPILPSISAKNKKAEGMMEPLYRSDRVS